MSRCLVPEFDGANFSIGRKETLSRDSQVAQRKGERVVGSWHRQPCGWLGRGYRLWRRPGGRVFLHLTPDVLDVVKHGRVFWQPFDGKVQLVRSATGSVRTASAPRNAAWAFTGAGPAATCASRDRIPPWRIRSARIGPCPPEHRTLGRCPWSLRRGVGGTGCYHPRWEVVSHPVV